MRNLKLALAVVGALALSIVGAIAQTPNITGNTFQTGQSGKTVQGMVGMCVNGANVAVPCGTGGTGTAVSLPAGSVAPGAFTAGSYAAGALAAGAFAAGSGVDGWDLTQGAKADSVCGTSTGNCSVIALLKFLNNAMIAATPAGTNNIGIVTLAGANVAPAGITPTIAASSHAAGSSFGGLQTVSFFRASSGFTGILNNVKWTWKTGTNLTAVTVYVFSATPSGGTTCTDATALTLAAADVAKLIPGSPFTLAPSVVGSGTTISTASQQSPVNVKNTDGTPGVNLYFCIVANAPVTPAANDGVLNVAGITD